MAALAYSPAALAANPWAPPDSMGDLGIDIARGQQHPAGGGIAPNAIHRRQGVDRPGHGRIPRRAKFQSHQRNDVRGIGQAVEAFGSRRSADSVRIPSARCADGPADPENRLTAITSNGQPAATAALRASPATVSPIFPPAPRTTSGPRSVGIQRTSSGVARSMRAPGQPSSGMTSGIMAGPSKRPARPADQAGTLDWCRASVPR